MNKYLRELSFVVNASVLILSFWWFSACTDDSPASRPSAPSGNAVTVQLPLQSQAKLEQLEQELSASSQLSTAALIERHQVKFTSSLGYDPLTAVNLSEIQASGLKLNDAESEALSQNGFVISNRQRFAHFVDGYKAAYLYHLPVYISADSILYALHRSYDDILKDFEKAYLANELTTLIKTMREHLRAGGADLLGEEAKADVDMESA